MIDLVSKIKQRRTYQLACSVPLVCGSTVMTEAGYEKAETTRTLDLGPGETRAGLPDAVADSPDVQRGLRMGWLGIRRLKPQPPPPAEAALPV